MAMPDTRYKQSCTSTFLSLMDGLQSQSCDDSKSRPELLEMEGGEDTRHVTFF